MANFLSISSIQPFVLSHNNKIANLKVFFVHSYDIHLLDKWITYKFNICVATNIKDYKLWAYI